MSEEQSKNTNLIYSLENLADQWHKEYEFLCGEYDDAQDKAAGRAFLRCAFELRELLSRNNNQQP